MKRLHLLLIFVIVLASVVYPMHLFVTDTTPAQFKDSAEEIESYPGPNAMWYAVGVMPIILAAGIVAAALLIVEWLSPKRWS